MKRIITIEAVKEAVEAAHAHFREEKSGKNADYIPYLKNVPSDLFGISVCLADGRSVTVGDTDYRFGIESVSKVPTAILAMNQYSAKKVLSQIGADATDCPSTRSWRSCWKTTILRRRWSTPARSQPAR